MEEYAKEVAVFKPVMPVYLFIDSFTPHLVLTWGNSRTFHGESIQASQEASPGSRSFCDLDRTSGRKRNLGDEGLLAGIWGSSIGSCVCP